MRTQGTDRFFFSLKSFFKVFSALLLSLPGRAEPFNFFVGVVSVDFLVSWHLSTCLTQKWRSVFAEGSRSPPLSCRLG